PALRAPARRLTADLDVNAVLDRSGIPRDRPLIVAESAWDDALVSELVTARRYWETKGLSTTLVVAPEQAVGAARPPRLADGFGAPPARPRPAAQRDALVAAAHLVVQESLPSVEPSETGSLATGLAPAPAITTPPAHADAGADSMGAGLRFFNGYGGFSPDGS